MRYSLDITRIPVIKPTDFKQQAENFNAVLEIFSSEPGDQMMMWLDGILRHLQSGGNVTVADLRRAAGLEVEPLDEFFGWDNSISLQLKVDEDHTIKFPLIHLRRLTPPMYPEEINWSAFDAVKKEGKEIDNFDYYNQFVKDIKDVHCLTDKQTAKFIAGKPYWESENDEIVGG